MDSIFNYYFNFLSNNRFERIWKLAVVDFKKRYYNNKLGIIWALINPLSQLAIYYFVFKFVFQAKEENYAIFLFIGIVVWLFFGSTTKSALFVFRQKKPLISNIQISYFDLFLSATLSSFIAYLFNLVILLISISFVQIPSLGGFFWILLLSLNMFLLALGISLLVSIIGIFISDFIHLWDIALIAGFWTSGIFFPMEKIRSVFEGSIYLNPVMGIIENFRRTTIWSQSPDYYIILINIVTSLLIFLIAYSLFRKYSKYALETL